MTRVPGLLLLALLAAEPGISDTRPQGPTDAGFPDAGPPDVQETALQIAQALVASDVEKLVGLTPLGFAFAGRQAWNQNDIRAEWIHALERRPLKGAVPAALGMLSYDEMVSRFGPPPERWGKVNLTGSRIAVVDLGGRAMLVIFRKRGDGWVLLGVSD